PPAGTGITEYLVTITATDICGNPITGEPVQIFALGNAGAIVLSPITFGALLNLTNASAVATPNAAGTIVASLEVLNTAIGTQGLVIKVVFPLQRLERFAV